MEERLNPSELADRIEIRIKKIMRAMTAACAALGADLVALALFAAICAGTGMKESNPEGLLIGCIAFLVIAIALVICYVALLAAAKIYAKKLTKLDAEIVEKNP